MRQWLNQCYLCSITNEKPKAQVYEFYLGGSLRVIIPQNENLFRGKLASNGVVQLNLNPSG